SRLAMASWYSGAGHLTVPDPSGRERRVERDLGDSGERLRDGAVDLRALGVLHEAVVVDAGHRPDDDDRALRDPLARLERDGDGGLEALGRRPRAGERV